MEEKGYPFFQFEITVGKDSKDVNKDNSKRYGRMVIFEDEITTKTAFNMFIEGAMKGIEKLFLYTGEEEIPDINKMLRLE